MIASTKYVTILFGMEGGGLGADGLALWDLQNGEMVFVTSLISTMVKWCLSPLGSLPIGILLGISDIEWELDLDISMETYLVFFPSFSGVSTCSEDLYLNSLRFISIYIFWEINLAIVGSIVRSGFLSLSQSGDHEKNWGLYW